MTRKEVKSGTAFKQVSRDFSKKAIKKSLKKHAISHWSVQYPIAGSVASLFGALILADLAPAFLALSGIGFLGGCAFWSLKRFVKADSFEIEYVEKMQREIEKETEERRRHLAEELAEHNCEKGQVQLSQFQKEYESLVQLLQAKFNETEITYKRYHGIIQEVYLSGIDNLRKVAAALMSISEIDDEELQKRIEELEPRDTELAREEIKSLKERLGIREKQLAKAEKRMLENENALTQLNGIASNIADMDTGLDEGKVDMENSMADLIRVIGSLKQRIEMKTKTKS
ncbi:MAG: hypothetical protein HQK83_10120 [Fibrobacteria bacterium]|nr:hypothetical protein [Fibrobacteria bacterium]